IKKVGKWVPFCCTLGGGVDLGLGITYEELCIKFSSILIGPKKFYRYFKNLVYEHKKCYDFSTSKLLANFRVFDRFPTIKTTHKEPCIKFSKFFGHPKIFYRHFKKNFSKKSKISVIPLTLTFEIKKVGKWVPFCCTLGGGVDLGLGITYEELCIKFSTTIKTTHKEPCIKFSKLFGHPKIFYRHFKKNFSKKSKISVIPLTLTFGENFKYFQ
ncbi:hypothetical protein AGLY_007663, partial [Aphis glycines]